MEVVFNETGHFWFDCGLTGLINARRNRLTKISTHIEDSKFVLDGAADDIKKLWKMPLLCL